MLSLMQGQIPTCTRSRWPSADHGSYRVVVGAGRLIRGTLNLS